MADLEALLDSLGPAVLFSVENFEALVEEPDRKLSNEKTLDRKEMDALPGKPVETNWLWGEDWDAAGE